MNPSQNEAIECIRGPLLLIAGAGTGKTTTIVNKISRLIEHKLARPEEILALTFTEKAAQEMQERVDEMMPYGYSQMQIGTFHSFADQILRAEVHHIGISPAFRLMTEAESVVFLKSNLFNLDLVYFRPIGNPSRFVWALLQHFSRIQDEDVTPEEYLKWAKKFARTHKNGDDKTESEKNLELARAYGHYQKLKIDHNLFDYADLIYYVLQLFRKRPNVLKTYRERYRYVLVDEFQDTNIAQYSLIKLLCPPSRKPNLTVVGDDSQAIYKFRGASVSNILTFMNDYKKAKQISLLTNYRSTQTILDTAYRLIQHNNPDTLESRLGISKELVTSDKNEGVPVEFILAGNAYDEAGDVVKKIKDLTKKYAFSDIAILVRAHSHSEPFARSLAQAGIPYQFHGASALFKQPHIKDLIAYIRFLADTDDSVSLYRVLNMDLFGIDPGDLHKVLLFTKKFNRTLFDGLRLFISFHEGGEGEAEEQVYKQYIPPLHDATYASLKKVYEMICRHIARIKKASAGQILYYFLEDTGYLHKLSTYTSEQEETIAQNISRFFDRLKNYELSHEDNSVFAVADFLTMSMELGESPSVEQTDLDEYNAVHILTAHGSKGLEFPVVFVVNLTQGRFPTRERKETIPIPAALIKEMLPSGNFHEQEERRLFYVAMTRAKERLILTAAQYYGEGKRLQKPSPFIAEALGDDAIVRMKTSKSDEKNQLSIFDFKTSEPIPVQKAPRQTLFLSYSQLETYKTCPLRYKYQHVIKLPTTPGASASFGTSIHSALQKFYEEFLEDKKVGLDRLLELYEANWVPLGYASRSHEQRQRAEGRLLLKNFFKTYHDPAKPVIEMEKMFKIRITPTVYMTGKMDRVDASGDDGIEIIDYKTGKRPTDKELAKNMQLSIYLLAATDRGLYNKQIGQVTLTFYYLQDNSKVSVTRTEQDLIDVKEQIVDAADDIRNRHFTPKVGIWCDYCPFRMVCEAWQ